MRLGFFSSWFTQPSTAGVTVSLDTFVEISLRIPALVESPPHRQLYEVKSQPPRQPFRANSKGLSKEEGGCKQLELTETLSGDNVNMNSTLILTLLPKLPFCCQTTQ